MKVSVFDVTYVHRGRMSKSSEIVILKPRPTH